MASNTFTLIASSTVGAGGASSIDFTSIPSTYTDLCVKLSLRNDYPATYNTVVCYQFNNSTSGYSAKTLVGTGSAAASYSLTTLTVGGVVYGRLGDGGMPTPTQTSNTFLNGEMYIPNYTGSANKSFSYDYVPENNGTNVYNDELIAGLWSNTAAITSIKFAPYNGSFVQYSTAYLYGISKS